MTPHALILAGGTGSRLRPLTLAVNKHLLPLHDRPVLYSPLALAIAAGARRVTVVVDPDHRAAFTRLLGDGSAFGIELELRCQDEPRGLIDALRAGLPGRGSGNPWLVLLGDCVVLDRRAPGLLRARLADLAPDAALAVASEVPDGRSYGVVRFADDGTVAGLEEKPLAPGPAWALPGVAAFGADLPERLPSARAAGVVDLPELHQRYLEADRLHIEFVNDPPLDWHDAGTPQTLAAAGAAVAADPAIASPELAAHNAGLLDVPHLIAAAERCAGSSYAGLLRTWAGADHG